MDTRRVVCIGRVHQAVIQWDDRQVGAVRVRQNHPHPAETVQADLATLRGMLMAAAIDTACRVLRLPVQSSKVRLMISEFVLFSSLLRDPVTDQSDSGAADRPKGHWKLFDAPWRTLRRRR